MPRKKKLSNPVEDGYQETIPPMLTSPFARPDTPEPSYRGRGIILFMYICQECGWWDISTGVDEIFGSLVRSPGLRYEPCEHCGYAPMYLVKRDDALYVTIHTPQEGIER